MSTRQSGLTISFTNLGRGQVIRDVSPDSLLPEQSNRVPGRLFVDGPNTPGSTNVRLDESLARARFGYKGYANKADANPVTGLFNVLYDDGTSHVLRGTSTTMERNASGTWTDINTGAETISATSADTWTFATARRAGTTTPRNQVIMCNGVDDVFSWTGSGALATVAPAVFKGARVVLGHLGRGFMMNVIDVVTGTRREQRVHYSITGDSSTHTGFGSGFVDLDDDQYPIAAATVVAGRIVVYKGSANGGSIVVGTPTGSINTPYRWDTINKGAGVGILLPRTLVHLSENLTFFLGHDGFYLHDGARGLAKLPARIDRDILSRLNYSSLRGGLAWYKPRLGVVIIGIPIGNDTFPSEYWVFNTRDRRVYGPYNYNHVFSAATIGDPDASAVTWSSSVGTWVTNPYASWATVDGPPGASAVLLGAENGDTMYDDDSASDDNGSAYTATWVSPAIIPKGWQLQFGNAVKVLDENAVLTLRDLTIRFRDAGVWNPDIAISTDGGTTFTTISDGSAVAGSNTEKMLNKSYTVEEIASSWFQVRVSGNGNMKLSGMNLSFTYAGDIRNE